MLAEEITPMPPEMQLVLFIAAAVGTTCFLLWNLCLQGQISSMHDRAATSRRELSSRLDRHDSEIMHTKERVEEINDGYNEIFDRIRDAIFDDSDEEDDD